MLPAVCLHRKHRSDGRRIPVLLVPAAGHGLPVRVLPEKEFIVVDAALCPLQAVFPGHVRFPDIRIELRVQIGCLFQILRRAFVHFSVRRLFRGGGFRAVVGIHPHQVSGLQSCLPGPGQEVLRQFLLDVVPVTLRQRTAAFRQLPGGFLLCLRQAVRRPDPDRITGFRGAQDQLFMVGTDNVTRSLQDPVQHLEGAVILFQQLKILLVHKVIHV